MLKVIGLIVLALVIVFFIFVSTREGKFRYEKSGLIKASPDKIFPYLSDFKKGKEWSPYEKVDPNMKHNFIGPDAQVGSVMEFDGNSNAGAGRLEILKIVPNELVKIRLIMTKPFKADHIVEYRLNPEAEGTRFTWMMSGDGGFMGKFLNVFVDCEKMVTGQFEDGIANLKNVVESQN